MPRLSKHQRQFEAVSSELTELKERLKALNEEIESHDSAISTFREDESCSGFKAPIVDLKTWLEECEERVIEVKEPLPSSVLYTKVVLECLSAGIISEHDMKALVIEMCRPLGVSCCYD